MALFSRDKPDAERLGPPWLGPVRHRTQLDTQWLLVAGVMLFSALIYFGYRGMANVLATAMTALGAYVLTVLLFQVIWPKRPTDSSLHALGLGLLLGLMMPPMRDNTLPILAGALLGMSVPIVGRSHRVRLHPVALVILAIWLMPAAFGNYSLRVLQDPPSGKLEAILRPAGIVFGDLKDVSDQYSVGPWWSLGDPGLTDAARRRDPGALVLRDGRQMLYSGRLVDMLQSGELSRVEELLIGAAPGPLGATSRALVIVLGVYLMYRRMSSWQTALAAIGAALLVLMVMPVSVENRVTIVGVRLLNLPWAVSIAFVGYLLLAPPLLAVVLLLSPMTAPLTERGRFVYGLALGATAMAAMWAFGATQGAYVGLAVASLISRPLDVMKRSPFVE